MRLRPPADEYSAVLKKLHTAHRAGEQIPVRMYIGLVQRGLLGPGVEPHDNRPGLLLIDRRAVGGVVEDRQTAVSVRSRMVLPPELTPGAHLEIGLFAVQPPDYRAGLPVDLVDSAGITRRDQQVPVLVDGDGVEVAVIVRPVRASIAAITHAELLIRLAYIDWRAVAIPAVPLEQQLPAGDVDLLDHPGNDVPARWTAHRAQVDARVPPVDGEKRG